MVENDGPRRLKSVDRAFHILDTIQKLDGARVSELAQYLDIPLSTVQVHVSTLYENCYLIKEGDEYHIALRFLEKGGYARGRKEVYTHAIAIVDSVAEETEERAQFIVPEHGVGIYLHTSTGAAAIQMDARLGKISRLHASAAGKAILAHFSEKEFDEFLEARGLPQLTPNTITDEEELRDEIATIRERGISFNDEESVEGLRAVGVPVLDSMDFVVGALSVSGPRYRMVDTRFEEQIPNLLLGSANEIELKAAYH